MNRSRLFPTAAALAAWSIVATPSFAAQDGHRGGDRSRAESRDRQDNHATQPPHENGARLGAPAPPATPRAQAVPRAAAPHFDQRFDQPRAPLPQPGGDERRFEQPRGPQPQPRGEERRFEPRRFEQPRNVQPERRFDDRRFEERRFGERRYEERRFIQPQAVRPNIVVSRPYYRPYYTFRPRVSLGFGLWIGYPVLYSNYGPGYYPSPYLYSAPYARSAPVPLPGTVAPTGGLSFDITPSDADLYVDGQYVGRAGDFSPTEQPLILTPGRHRLEIGAPGYQTLVFDTDIIAGQVIPYQGGMQPQ